MKSLTQIFCDCTLYPSIVSAGICSHWVFFYYVYNLFIFRICNNVGNCTCSKCDCFEGYSGEMCECNDRNCPYHNGSLCGGKSFTVKSLCIDSYVNYISVIHLALSADVLEIHVKNEM